MAVWRLVDVHFAYHAHHIAYHAPYFWDVRSWECALQVLMPVGCPHSEMVVIVHCDAPELSPYQRDDHQQVRAIK